LKDAEIISASDENCNFQTGKEVVQSPRNISLRISFYCCAPIPLMRPNRWLWSGSDGFCITLAHHAYLLLVAGGIMSSCVVYGDRMKEFVMDTARSNITTQMGM
jgi:hypothetical protein